MHAHEPSRAHWTRVDESSDPRWFIRLLDATRIRMLQAATADPAGFFGYLHLVPGLEGRSPRWFASHGPGHA